MNLATTKRVLSLGLGSSRVNSLLEVRSYYLFLTARCSMGFLKGFLDLFWWSLGRDGAVKDLWRIFQRILFEGGGKGDVEWDFCGWLKDFPTCSDVLWVGTEISRIFQGFFRFKWDSFSSWKDSLRCVDLIRPTMRFLKVLGDPSESDWILVVSWRIARGSFDFFGSEWDFRGSSRASSEILVISFIHSFLFKADSSVRGAVHLDVA